MNWVNDLFARAPVSWRDVLDIAIVTVVIYEVLKLIRGTRAAQMVVGAGLMVGLLFLSQVAHLETVNWLIRNVVGYVVFAAIVLFQSDIRRALAHFGRAPFFRLLTKGHAAEEAVEEITVAQLHRGGHPARRQGELRPARDHFQQGVAPSRRCGDRARRSYRRGRVLPAADGQPAPEP